MTPLSVHFLNADPNSDEEPQKVHVTIHDPDKLLFTPLGIQHSEVTVQNGYLSLVVGWKKNIGRPYRITLRASADGFLAKTQTIVIDEYQSSYVPVNMMPVSNLPEGVSSIQTTAALAPGSIIKNDMIIDTKPSGSGESELSANLKIDQGTVLLGKNNDNIQDPVDSVNIEFFQFDPRFPASVNAFPNGFMVTDAVNESGSTIASLSSSFFFSSLGYIDLKMLVGSQEVYGFSKPITVEMEIPTDLLDPSTGETIKENNTVPVWSLDPTTGQWVNEADVNLYMKGEKLFGRFEMRHLSAWNLDQKTAACTPPNSGKITININNSPGFKARFAKFENSSDPPIVFSPTNANSVLLLESSTTHTLEIVRAPDIGDLNFVLYNSARPDIEEHRLTNVSCSETRNISLTGTNCAHFAIEINCTDHSPNCFRPTLTGLWYERGITTGEPGDIHYDIAYYMGVLSGGEIDVDLSDINTGFYRFKIQVNSGPLESDLVDYLFTLYYDEANDLWDEDPIDLSVNVLNPTNSLPCLKSYIIQLNTACQFDPGSIC